MAVLASASASVVLFAMLPRMLIGLQHLMHKRDRNRPFANGGGDTLDVAAAHIADRKYTRAARFEEERRACQRPVRGVQFFGRQSGTGLDESLVIERETTAQP